VIENEEKALSSAYTSSNFRKHTSRNPLQRSLIGRFHARLARLIASLPVHTALDAGCGEGFVLRHLRAHLPALELHGADLDQAALAMARHLTSGVAFCRGSVYALPYAAESFELVLCTEVLEHLGEPERALAELGRVSKRYCLLTVPWEPPYSLANLLRGKNLKRWGSDAGHLQRWSTHGFARLIRAHFAVRSAGTSFPWIVVLAEKR